MFLKYNLNFVLLLTSDKQFKNLTEKTPYSVARIVDMQRRIVIWFENQLIDQTKILKRIYVTCDVLSHSRQLLVAGSGAWREEKLRFN